MARGFSGWCGFCASLLASACSSPPGQGLYLGPPGTEETHAVVEVHPGPVTQAVWRLRSRVSVQESNNDSLLPAQAPTSAIAMPTTYAVVARGHSGTLSIQVEAMDQDGWVVGEAAGTVELEDGQAVRVALTLQKHCSTDGECQDGVFCNGPERCVEGTCTAGREACPPSTRTCVSVSCVEGEKRCAVDTDVQQCPPQQDAWGTPMPVYCDAQAGCRVGVPGAPRLADAPVVTPDVGTVGTEFRVAFTVNEPLPQDPVVQVDVGGRRAPLLVDEAGTDRAVYRYRFLYVADGSEAAGRRPVAVDLVDWAGETAPRVEGGSLVLDFSPPRLERVGLGAQTFLAAGARVSLDLEFNEPLAATPRVRMAPAGQLPGPDSLAWEREQGEGTTWHFSFQAQPPVPEGAYVVWVRAADVAGNTSGDLEAGAVTLDFTPPGVAADPPARVTPSLAAAGRTVVVTVDADEEVLPGVAQLTATAGSREILFETGESVQRRLSFLHTVAAGEDGSYALRLSGLRDRAGNPGAAVDVGHVTFDCLAPEIGTVVANAAAFSAQPGFNQVELQVPVDGAPASLEASLEGKPVACTRTSGGAAGLAVFTCTSAVTDQDHEGVRLVTLRALDAAGNLAVGGFPLVLDFTGPKLLPEATQLQLSPSPLSPVSYASALGTGGLAVLGLAFDGPVEGEPEVATEHPQRLEFMVMSCSGSYCWYGLSLGDEDPINGVYDLVVRARDALGNLGESRIPDLGLVVDTQAPELPDPAPLGAFTHVRNPWGSNATVATPSISLRCAAGSVPEPGTVLVYADSGYQQELGRGTTNGGGEVSIPLARDTPMVYAVLVDSAGNMSAPMEVKDGLWTATLAGKVAGNTSLNPHSYLQTFRLETALDLPVGVLEQPSTQELSNLGLVDNLAVAASLTPNWYAWPGGSGSHPERVYATVAYDAKRGRSVLMGGLESVTFNFTQDTLELVGSRWVSIASVSMPPVAMGVKNAATFDGARGCVVLLDAGAAASGGRTWEWDGAAWSRRSTTVDPPPRSHAGLAFDPERRVAVLYGGAGASGFPTDTWEWDGTGWQERTPAHNPGGRRAFGMVAHRGRGTVLLFGGQGPNNTSHGDTWEYDGQDWREVVTAHAPSARYDMDMAYDTARDAVVLFGGRGAPAEADTWEFRDGDWHLVTPATTVPLGRHLHSLVYDAAQRRTLMTGGWTVTSAPSGTWAWDGTDWSPVVESPSPRHGNVLVGQGDRGRVLLFGGESEGMVLGDTWEWDGASWTSHPQAGGPSARSGAAAAFDSARGRVVAFGGFDGQDQADTWAWDGTRWEPLQPDTRPPPMSRAAAAYDRARDRVVLLGLGGTWEFDGSTWEEKSPGQAPGTLEGQALAYDAERGVTLCYGGQETWEWDGGAWSLRSTYGGGVVVADDGVTLAFDDALRRVVLVGGHNSMGQSLADVASWDGERWLVVDSPARPPPRAFHSAAYDSRRGRMVVFGGLSGPEELADLWEWDAGLRDRPTALVQVAWDYPGIPTAHITSLSLSAAAGGRGTTVAVPPALAEAVSGATLLGWNAPRGAWEELARTTAPPEWAEALAYRAPDALAAQDFVVERTGKMSFALQTAAERGNGVDRAVLAVDNVEVEIGYRRP